MAAKLTGYTIRSDDEIRPRIGIEGEYLRHPVLLRDTVMWKKHQPGKLGFASASWRQRKDNLARAMLWPVARYQPFPFVGPPPEDPPPNNLLRNDIASTLHCDA